MTGLIVSAQGAGIHNHSQNPIRENGDHYYGNDLWVTGIQWDKRVCNPDKDIVWSHLLHFLLCKFQKFRWFDESVIIFFFFVLFTMKEVRFVLWCIANFLPLFHCLILWVSARLRKQRKKKKLTVCFFFFFFLFAVAPSLREHTHLGITGVSSRISVCFEPHFDTLTLKRQLHKFTLCQINQ